jgi:hypothetical protein
MNMNNIYISWTNERNISYFNNGLAVTNLDKKIDTAHNGYISRYAKTARNDL